MARVLEGLDLPALRVVDEAVTLLTRSAAAAFAVAGGQPDAAGETGDEAAEGRAARDACGGGGETHAEDNAIRPLA
jgi:hypothetical protein